MSAQNAEKAILKGSNNVKVANRADADAIRRNLFTGQGYQNTSGLTGNMARNTLPNRKAGTFHWDYGDTIHGGMSHLQVHDFNGTVYRIFFEKGGGIPISPYK